MNKGDKVRIKDTWVGNPSFDGLEAEVIEVDHSTGPYLKPLSDRPDGCKRVEFYWPESKLELIPEEKSFEVGDKVRVVRDTISAWGRHVPTGTTGTIGTVTDTDGGYDYIEVRDLSTDDENRMLNVADLELIPEERTFKVGDRVKILGTTTTFLKDTIGRFGTVIAAVGDSSLRVDVDDYAHGESGSEWYYDPSKVELVTEEKQTIDVGDTVKATHAESGSVVQGVVSYTDLNNDDLPTNIEIIIQPGGTLDLYTYQGWEFELIAKKEVPKPAPQVGDVVEDAASLPVGTVTRTSDFSGTYLHTAEGWRSKSGTLFTYPDILDNTIIVYLPPTASE